jgi:hypothetical protein
MIGIETGVREGIGIGVSEIMKTGVRVAPLLPHPCSTSYNT